MCVIALQNLSVLTNLSNADTFSGRGYLAIPAGGASVFFTLQVPVTSYYFIVLRYLVSFLAWSVSVRIAYFCIIP